MSVVCSICRSDAPLREVYRGPIRAGGFGKLTSRDHVIAECCECGAQRLVGAEQISYEDDDYRRDYDGSEDVEHFFALHDPEQSARLARVGFEAVRGARIGDFGCGPGAFLDVVRGAARETFAVEPSTTFRAHLASRGHKVFGYASELPPASLDVAVSFQVLEHVEDAAGFLRDVHTSLRPGGQLILSTPNREDVLFRLGAPDYAAFFYRTAHHWYFNAASLERAATGAGFVDVRVSSEHHYDLSNAFCWMRDRRPTGRGRLGFFDERLEASWRSFLEEKMLGDTLWLIAAKPAVDTPAKP